MTLARQRSSRTAPVQRNRARETTDTSRCARTPEMKREIAGFWRRVDKSGGGCWLWRGAITAGGYGIYRRVLAHRYSYRLCKGPIDGVVVRHACDTPLCVRPTHLRGGSHRDNIADKMAKGRARGGRKGQIGELNNGAVVTTAQAKAALNLWSKGYRLAEIARLTGIRTENAKSIVTRRTWAHVEPEHYEIVDRLVDAISRELVSMGFVDGLLGETESAFRELFRLVLELRLCS